MLNRAGGLDANAAFALGVVVAGAVVGAALLFGGGFGKGCPPGALSASIQDVMYAERYSWDALLTDVRDLTFDTRGESNHTLFKGGTAQTARGSIQRSSKSGSRKESCFDNTPVVVAVIQTTEDLPPYLGVGTTENKNYFVVWHDKTVSPDKWHGAILNQSTRTEYAEFTYLPHWRQGHPNKPDDETNPPTELAPIYDACWSATKPTRRACFGEPTTQVAAGVGMGLGLGTLVLRQGDSEPWVSCAAYGCCCGGTGCHDEK
jgi:hypothetical protein